MLFQNGLIVNRLIFIFFFIFFTFQVYSQKFIGSSGEISFFSEAPLEDISAINKNVSAVFDSATNDLVFNVKITDFIFPIPLMQEHFNENYLESDLYPNSTFLGKVVKRSGNQAFVEGYLKIHGRSNKINVEGLMEQDLNTINISGIFTIKLKDYNIKIPKIVMYKIAEEIDVKIDISLDKIK